MRVASRLRCNKRALCKYARCSGSPVSPPLFLSPAISSRRPFAVSSKFLRRDMRPRCHSSDALEPGNCLHPWRATAINRRSGRWRAQRLIGLHRVVGSRVSRAREREGDAKFEIPVECAKLTRLRLGLLRKKIAAPLPARKCRHLARSTTMKFKQSVGEMLARFARRQTRARAH